jgi:hypothetical protein
MTPAISDHPYMNQLTAKAQGVLLFSLELLCDLCVSAVKTLFMDGDKPARE